MSDAVVPVEAPGRRGSYFARHWRGELSLPKSWWVNGVLLCGLLLNGILGALLFGVFNVLNQSHPGVGPADLEMLLYLAIALTAYIWVAVGIWRSAGNYKGPALWKWWAKIGVCLSIVINGWIVAGNLVVIQRAASTAGTTIVPR